MAKGVAARVAGVQRRYGSFAAPSLGSGADERTHPIVELFLNEQWVDISSYVYYRDMITIRRGQTSEGSTPDPSTCTLTLNNRDGRFSPRNPVGAYYGFLVRNVPLRVAVIRHGVRYYRFYGEVSTWPVQWDQSGQDVWVSIEASGITRRIGRNSEPLHSAIYRELTKDTRTGIVAYWPFEDGTTSVEISSGISGDPAMVITGAPTFAVDQGWFGSDALPTIESAKFGVNPTSYTTTGETSAKMLAFVPTGGISSDSVLLRLSTTGTADRWDLVVEGTNGGLALRAYSDGVQVLNTGFVAFAVNGKRQAFVVQLVQNGADVDYTVTRENYTSLTSAVQSVPVSTTSGTLAGYTVGRVQRMVVNPDQHAFTEVSFGHLALATDVDSYANTLYSVMGWIDENPTTRMIRLSSEESMDFQVVNKGITSGNFTSMGAQGTSSYLDLMRECAFSDDGILYEPVDRLGINYRSRLSLYSRDATLALDYDQNELSAPPAPTDDDQYTQNDVTLNRIGGSFARAIQESGAMSVLEPPDGVSRYKTSIDVSVGTQLVGFVNQVENQAAWRLHLGTVDEARYPSLSVNLRYPTFTSSTDHLNAALAVDIGDRVTVSNPPAWLPQLTIDQMVIGYTEVLGFVEHDIAFVCRPGSAYNVAVADGTYGRMDTDGSTLTSDISATATSVSVTTQSGSAVWCDSATYASEFPFDIVVGGETMTVTAITGTTSPQTFTVTRSVNGISKTQSAGTAVNVLYPAIIAL